MIRWLLWLAWGLVAWRHGLAHLLHTLRADGAADGLEPETARHFDRARRSRRRLRRALRRMECARPGALPRDLVATGAP